MDTRKKKRIDVPRGKKLIFRPYVTRGGRTIWAHTLGLRAFPILVDE